MGLSEELAGAAAQALRGDTARAMERLCRSVVGLGFAHAQVICIPSGSSRCVPVPSLPPAPAWIERELRQNRVLRQSLPRGRRYQGSGLTTHPLRVDGGVVGALVVGPRRAPGAPHEVPAPLLELLSATLQAFSRTLAHSRQLRSARAAVRRVESAEEHLRRRLSLARHDLKAPLVPLKGYLDMILRGMAGPVSPTGQRYLLRSKEAVNRLRDLIDFRLQDPSAPTSDLRAVVLEVASGRHRPVRVEVPEQPCWVMAPPETLRAAVRTWIRGLLATSAPGVPLDLRLRRGEDGWELDLTSDPYATLPARAARQSAALLAACGGRLGLSPTGVRALLPFDPRVEVAPPSPRPSIPAAAPPGEAADRG